MIMNIMVGVMAVAAAAAGLYAWKSETIGEKNNNEEQNTEENRK